MFEEVYQRYKKRDVAFVGIFVEDTDAAARAFLNTHPMSFPSGCDWPLALAKPLGFRHIDNALEYDRGAISWPVVSHYP